MTSEQPPRRWPESSPHDDRDFHLTATGAIPFDVHDSWQCPLRCVSCGRPLARTLSRWHSPADHGDICQLCAGAMIARATGLRFALPIRLPPRDP
jgi:hypothetical protein